MRIHSDKNYKHKFLRMPLTLTSMLLALAVAGCSILPEMPEMPEMPKMPDLPEMPNWINPTSWTAGLFTGNDNSEITQDELASTAKPFPKLGSVPKLKSTTAAEERKILAKSLVADRESARYTDQNLRAGDNHIALVSKAPIPKAKPLPPRPPKPLLVAPSSKRLVVPSKINRLSGSSRQAMNKSNNLKMVPSIVQRKGDLPLPPAPIGEVSRGLIPKIVEKSRYTVRVSKEDSSSKSVPLENKPVSIKKKLQIKSKENQAIVKVVPPPASNTVSQTAVKLVPPPASNTDSQTAVKLVPPPASNAVSQAAVKLVPSSTPNAIGQTGVGFESAATSKLLLPIGVEQSVLAQTFIASLAAQANQTVSQPGNVFNSPTASPIAGEWSTVVPGVVKQAFNSSIIGSGQRVLPSVIAKPISTSPLKLRNGNRPLQPGDPTLIRFGHGSTSLTNDEKMQLRKVANQVVTSGKLVYVVGHASRRTIDMDYARHKLVNFNVSLDRANKVANELRRRGVSSENLIVQARGDNEPLYFEYMPNGEALNRRVEIFIR